MEQEKRYFYWLPILFAAGIWSSTSETSLFVIDILLSLLFCSSWALSEETVGKSITGRSGMAAYGYGPARLIHTTTIKLILYR